jgi:hypothetical protein
MQQFVLKLILLFLGLQSSAFALLPTRPSGLGQVANNLMDPVHMFANFIGSMSIIIGIAFLLGSFHKYSQHRRNHMAAPISTVIFLLIMGVVLIVLPFIHNLTQAGVPVHL